MTTLIEQGQKLKMENVNLREKLEALEADENKIRRLRFITTD
jgi:hypothetical protein